MPTQAIVFCRTKKRVDEVARGLSLRGYNAELIHGDIPQQKRTSVINAFRQGQVELLVATDVAARGLDISGVTHVYNYDIRGFVVRSRLSESDDAVNSRVQ